MGIPELLEHLHCLPASFICLLIPVLHRRVLFPVKNTWPGYRPTSVSAQLIDGDGQPAQLDIRLASPHAAN